VRELVDRSVRGDAEAFGGIYDLLCDDVYRYFYYQVGRSEDAEDLVSSTFLRAWRAIGAFRWRSRPFEAWLFTIARNQLMDFYRQRRAVIVELDEECLDARPGPEALALEKLDQLQTRDALSRLTAEQREVLVLRFYLDRETAEIARLMGKREGTVRGLQMRGLRALRRLLDD
jgi:RNA polymerase sigma-70 factor (ECF subfamily)